MSFAVGKCYHTRPPQNAAFFFLASVARVFETMATHMATALQTLHQFGTFYSSHRVVNRLSTPISGLSFQHDGTRKT